MKKMERLFSAIAVGGLAFVIAPVTAAGDTETRVSSDLSISYGGFGTANTLASVALERRFGPRLHVALRVGAGLWPGIQGLTSTIVTEETLEVGFKLRPSRSLGLLLGWRVGHAYFEKAQGVFASVEVSALALEPITKISFALSTDWSILFLPFTMNFYKSRVWALTVGTEVGIVRRF